MIGPCQFGGIVGSGDEAKFYDDGWQVDFSQDVIVGLANAAIAVGSLLQDVLMNGGSEVGGSLASRIVVGFEAINLGMIKADGVGMEADQGNDVLLLNVLLDLLDSVAQGQSLIAIAGENDGNLLLELLGGSLSNVEHDGFFLESRFADGTNVIAAMPRIEDDDGLRVSCGGGCRCRGLLQV